MISSCNLIYVSLSIWKWKERTWKMWLPLILMLTQLGIKFKSSKEVSKNLENGIKGWNWSTSGGAYLGMLMSKKEKAGSSHSHSFHWYLPSLHYLYSADSGLYWEDTFFSLYLSGFFFLSASSSLFVCWDDDNEALKNLFLEPFLCTSGFCSLWSARSFVSPSWQHRRDQCLRSIGEQCLF